MKAPALFAIVVGVVVGFLLGGIAPRGKLHEAEDKIAAMEKRVAEAEKRARTSGGGNRFLPFFPDDADWARPTPAPVASGAPTPEESDEDDGDDPRTKEEQMRAFSLAADAQRMRTGQSRQALIEKARLKDEKLDAVDAIIADMNAKLKGYADEAIEVAMSGDEPEARDMLEMTHEVSGVLLEAQRDFEEQIGPGGVGALEESEGEIWNYVDLETFREAYERAIGDQ